MLEFGVTPASQAALDGILSAKPRSGLAILNLWTPAHIGTTGNELADIAAKVATTMEPDPLAFVSLTMVRCLIHLQALDDWTPGALRYIDKSLLSLELLPLYSSLVILGLLLRTSSFIAIRKKMRPCPSEAVVLPHDGSMNGVSDTLVALLRDFWTILLAPRHLLTLGDTGPLFILQQSNALIGTATSITAQPATHISTSYSMSSDQADLLLQLAHDSRVTESVAASVHLVPILNALILDRDSPQFTYGNAIGYSKDRFQHIKMHLSPSSCFIALQVQGTSATIIIGIVDIILLLRIWILYERARRTLYVLLAMIIVEIAIMICITTLTVNNLTEFVHVGFINGCYSPDVPRYFAAYPIPSLIVSCSMFLLTVRICARRIAASRPYNTQSIIVVFLRDGVLWFLVVALINPPQIALWAWGRPSLIQVLMMPALAGYSVIGARVLLNMMEIAAGGACANDDEL
ncbi:hypothetical protein B0H13DRAFT_2443981 [Mycena leptocephala]|nr:hypothetical protein B0H13DRAFT_2443981 [Mycena leptocephala]